MDDTKKMKDRERLCSLASPKEVADAIKPLVEFGDRGMPLGEIDTLLKERLAPHLMRYGSASFQSMFNAFPEAGAALGAKFALEWNQGVTNWQVSPGGAVLEEKSVKALIELLGLSPNADGTYMYCGTYANQQAIYLALHRHAEKCGFNLAEKGLCGFGEPSRLAIATSVDAHFSIRHAVRMLGLGEHSLIAIAVDKNRKIDPERLAEILDEQSGERNVFCVVATAGTTSTGAVDPIDRLANLTAKHSIWLHVDGAYGLAYKLVPGWTDLFHGVDRADSVSWDPHKQFGVPIPNSLLFARNTADFDRMALTSSYFNRDDSRGPNPGFKSAPSTRPLAALPLVTSILHQGRAGVIERLKAPLLAIRDLAAYVSRQPDLELCHFPDTGILCFRLVRKNSNEAELNALNKKIYQAINETGERSIAITELDGRTVLRLVAISPKVSSSSLIETIEAIRAVGREL